MKEHLTIEKRKSPYSSEKLSQLLVIQNILGYDRIEGSRVLNQDAVLKRKLGILHYPDPETFRDELARYRAEGHGGAVFRQHEHRRGTLPLG